MCGSLHCTTKIGESLCGIVSAAAQTAGVLGCKKVEEQWGMKGRSSIKSEESIAEEEDRKEEKKQKGMWAYVPE